jgi:hypothetical protein
MNGTLTLGWILTAAVLLSAVSCAASGLEYRGRLEMSGRIENDLWLKMLTEVRSRNSLLTHNESHFSVGIEWVSNRWFAVGSHYRHVTKQRCGIWTVEHRPYFDVTVKGNYHGMSTSNRNRLEYRMQEGRSDFRYRLRLMLTAPEILLPGFRPCFSAELSYAFQAGEADKTRLTAGFDLRAVGSIRLGVNYVLDSVKTSSRWQDLNAITVALKYRP